MNFSNFLSRTRYIPFALLLVVAFLLYGNSINGEFLLDDYGLIVNNESITSLGNIGDFFTHHRLHGTGLESNLYRPIPTLVNAFLFSIFKLNAVGYHIANILLYAVNGLLVYGILRRLSFSQILGFCGTLLYFVHPIHTEVVAYIAGMTDLLHNFVILLPIFLFLNPKRGRVDFFGICALGVIAAFTKESSVMLMPLIGLFAGMEFLTSGKKEVKRNKENAILLIWLTCVFIVFFTLKFTVFNFAENGLGLTTETDAYVENLGVRLLTFLHVIPEYLRLIFFPKDLFFYKPASEFVTHLTLKGILGIITITSVCVGSYYSFFKNKLYSIGLMWAGLSLIPFMGIIPLNALYTERWITISLIGIIIVLLEIVRSMCIKNRQKYVSVFFVIVLIVLGGRTIERSNEWASNLDFYLNEVEHHPNSAMLHNEVGVAYMKSGDLEKAIEYYEISLHKDPSFGFAHFNLANTYMNLGLHEQGIEQYYETLYDEHILDAYRALHQIYTHLTGEPEKAAQIEVLLKKIEAGKFVSREELDMTRN